jgi:hypothetical protein
MAGRCGVFTINYNLFKRLIQINYTGKLSDFLTSFLLGKFLFFGRFNHQVQKWFKG